jgi:LemA protein
MANLSNLRIPDEKAPEVFELAARLYAERSQSYSVDDLVAAGSEVQIPPEFVQEALRQIQVREAQQQQQQQQRAARRKQFSMVAIGAGVIVLGWLGWTYNALSGAAQNVDLAWAQVENQFQRRADLIPNLVNVTRSGAQQEQALVAQLTQARQNYLSADSQPEQVEAAEQITGALNQFQTYAIQNPQLQSNQLFVGLQDELAGTENRIAVERMRYNQSVGTYNRQVRSFPNSLVAPVFGFAPKPLFEADPGTSEPPAIAPNLAQ